MLQLRSMGRRSESSCAQQRRAEGNRDIDSLVHPVRGGFEPLDDLVVVECEEDSGDETDNIYDIVPW